MKLTSVTNKVLKFDGLAILTVNGTLYDGSSKHGKIFRAKFGRFCVAKYELYKNVLY